MNNIFFFPNGYLTVSNGVENIHKENVLINAIQKLINDNKVSENDTLYTHDKIYTIKEFMENDNGDSNKRNSSE